MKRPSHADRCQCGSHVPADLLPLVSRRAFLERNALGLGGVALACLLGEEKLLANPPTKPVDPHVSDLKPRQPHFRPRAKAMISLFMQGGPSHVDLLDPKPELTRLDNTDYDRQVEFSGVNRASRKLFASPWKFAPHGASGIEVSELLPHTAGIVDDICLIRSMKAQINNHDLRYFFGGIPNIPGRPALGAWMLYGLGCESQDLPAYVVLSDPASLPVDEAMNWSAGFMPPMFQGTLLRPQEPRIVNLDPPARLKGLPQQQNMALLAELNRRHLDGHPHEADLEARIASYELAARMQTAAKEALDVGQETADTHKLYGLDNPTTRDFGTRCLIARRLVERGVRFVQLFLNYQAWDHHLNIRGSLPAVCLRSDQPSAALVSDLKARGLLDTTVVHWGGEIGRLPVMETEADPKNAGRDHNGQGFSMWLAGGGFRGGMTFGATDEVGHRAVENIVTPNDFQATLLHQFGLDHQKLVYHHNGRDQSLTDGRPARVVGEIIETAGV
ncbi:MAG TPA: DUF1501 domain-containing protein [Pirellulales bacterium]|jgi:hypothetical protein|nr:DUF1501 domain-containing protein [Pirellulales bacterium]